MTFDFNIYDHEILTRQMLIRHDTRIDSSRTTNVLTEPNLLLRLSSPDEVNWKIKMNTRVRKILLHLCHEHLNLLITPPKNT